MTGRKHMDYVTGEIGEIKLKIRSELDRKPFYKPYKCCYFILNLLRMYPM